MKNSSDEDTLSFIGTIVVIIFIVFSLGYSLTNTLKHPECMFSKDIGLCSVIVEKK